MASLRIKNGSRVRLLDAAAVETPLPLDYNIALSEVTARTKRRKYDGSQAAFYDTALLEEIRGWLEMQGNHFITLGVIKKVWR